MKNKIIYLLILIFSISLITSAKKAADCRPSACSRVKQKQEEKKTKNESKAELSSLSLFFFNI